MTAHYAHLAATTPRYGDLGWAGREILLGLAMLGALALLAVVVAFIACRIRRVSPHDAALASALRARPSELATRSGRPTVRGVLARRTLAAERARGGTVAGGQIFR